MGETDERQSAMGGFGPRAIEQQGGMVIVPAPSSAKFASVNFNRMLSVDRVTGVV